MNSLEEEIRDLSFFNKLLYLIENSELEFWEDRRNPPNLSKDEFELIMARIEGPLNLKWVNRESGGGKHGTNGEKKCFKFNCVAEFGGVFEIESKHYFVKGFFFDEGNLKGVTIQSFREEQYGN